MTTLAVLALVGGFGVSAASAQAAVELCQGHPVTIAATATGVPVTGTEGSDVIGVGRFTDVQIDAKGGDDIVCGGRWSTIYGGPGADSFSGVPSTTLAYSDAASGVDIDLASGSVLDGGEVDTVAGIHRVQGSPYDDTFVGTAGRDDYNSGDYYTPELEDVLVHGDTVDAGAGDDTVRVRLGDVDLGAGDDLATVAGGTVNGGAGDDELYLVTSGVANGGPGADIIRPSVSTEEFGEPQEDARLLVNGGAGRDVIVHPVAYTVGEFCPGVCAVGDLRGGPGRDVLTFLSRGAVDLAVGKARSAHSRSQVRSVESVVGSDEDDVLRGNAARNRLVGNGGRDVLVGRGGRDVAVGGTGRDRC
ncbi:hypothetical protein ACFP8W_06895, partial [Nocardioides hankookensis]